jgi:hypothetical protein
MLLLMIQLPESGSSRWRERSVTIDTRPLRRRRLSPPLHRQLDMSWILPHDSARRLVYTFDAPHGAPSGSPRLVADSSLQLTCTTTSAATRRLSSSRPRLLAMKKKLPVTPDVIKKIHLILHLAERATSRRSGTGRTSPQHRLYFHE